MSSIANVYLMEISDDLMWKDICHLNKYVSSHRQHRLKKFRNDRDKISSLMTGLMTRIIINRNTGISKESLNFHINKFGKPQLTNIKGYEFSISHTYGISVFADYNTSIGIDVETLSQNIKEYDSIAKNNFTENEVIYINSSANPQREFIKIWTAKEAYVKMLGTGLTTPLSSFDVINGVNGCSIITIEHKSAAISVCCSNSCKSINIIPVTVKEIIECYN